MSAGKGKRTGWTPEKRAKFLAELASTGNVSLSAKLCGLSRTRAYALREHEPDFASAWDDSVSESADALEAEARRRAVQGVEKPVYQGGKLVGHVQEYSDTLLIFLLKGNNPAKFGDRARLEHSGKIGLELTAEQTDAALRAVGLVPPVIVGKD